MLAGLALVGVGTFFAQATATGFVGRAATTDRGSASGIYLACYFFGGLVGSAVLGQLFDRFGWAACVAGIGAALAVAALLAFRLKMPAAAQRRVAAMQVREFVELAGTAAEIAGVVLIIGGLVIASARYVLPAGIGSVPRYQRYRQDLGRAILLGLEVLVAADIVRTVAFTPTMDSVIVLAMIVAIRTFLSWSLALELEGRWPWQRAAERLAPEPQPQR